MWIEPVTLVGSLVRLEPLAPEHEDALWEVGQDPEIWQFMSADVHTRADLHQWIAEALRQQQTGAHVPFAIIDRAGGRAIGSTRYFDISESHRHLEIGHTWLGKRYWRTGVNTECKYLLLRHAFETLGCARVQLKTDKLNLRSQTAIKRLGAVEEGTLRKHMWVQNRRFRDTVFFSILDDEWPAVREKLRGSDAGPEITSTRQT
jgi:N-acetyltransferase